MLYKPRRHAASNGHLLLANAHIGFWEQWQVG